MRTKEEVLLAASEARDKWKATGDPIWACAEGALAWVLEEPVASYIEEVFEADLPYDRRRDG